MRPLHQGPLAEGGEMSVYSCISISRGCARMYMVNLILNAPDDVLASMMDQTLSDRLYQVNIVPEGIPNDDEVIK